MSVELPVLNETNLHKIVATHSEPIYDHVALPEKVVQFGEGNFLRAFVDWMIDESNRRGDFNGRIALVQPIERGLAQAINAQDGLYTLVQRGLHSGHRVDRTQIIQAVSRCIDPYQEWDVLLALAWNPDLRFAVSNTTEAGITMVEETREPTQCPKSFPAKLTAFLYERFVAFRGDTAKGLVLLPCELIDRNGDKLKACIEQHITNWKLGDEFAKWFHDACTVCNTLVDRIVPGYPSDEADSLTQRLGYRDSLMVSGEPFHLWVIEGPESLAAELPLTTAGLDVVWTNDMTPYRTRKVRMLNGPHTMLVAAAYLAGLNTVREAVEDETVGAFLRRGLFDEILPLLDFAEEDKHGFAEAVIERFGNPFIKHQLLSITLNATSKFRVRVLPSLTESLAATGTIPAIMGFGLAANLAFTKPVRREESHLVGQRSGDEYRILDDSTCLDAYQAAWEAHATGGTLEELVTELLGNHDLWHEDLTAIPGLVDAVSTHLSAICEHGCREAMDQLLTAEASA